MASAAEVSEPPSLLRRVLIGRNPRRTMVRMAVWVVAAVLISKYVLLPIRVQGISMMPTYKAGSINFVNCLVYRFHPPQRGDVVGIKLAGPHVMYMKRVIGLPGETITFHEGHVFINGELLTEDYIKYPCNWEHEPELIGPNEYYVVGDNRSMDFYDHEQGRSKRDRIVGKIVL
jgi:signal peptidase I